MMCIALHPYAIGKPHRVKYLDRTLSYIMSHDGVWQTTADEIAEYKSVSHRPPFRGVGKTVSS